MGRTPKDISLFTVDRDSPIADVIRRIDSNGEGLALLVDDDGRLVATITDGDIRRALLNRAALEDPAAVLLGQEKRGPHSDGPTVATQDMPDADLLHLMTEKVVRQVPILDTEGRVIDITFMHELVEELEEHSEAIVMAGGVGSRLLPLTEKVPKPLLPIGDKPVMERIIDQLQGAGIRKVNVAVHHMSDKIASHFGDGSHLGVDLTYVTEDKPLGTAGSLRKLAGATEPFIVINADIVTTMSYRAFLAYHREHGAEITVAVRRYEVSVPYGVLHCDRARVTGLAEKPVTSFLVNAGIYLVEPRVIRFIPENEPFDMTDLVTKVLESNGSVCAFPVHEYWLDVGRHEDYASAQEAHQKGFLE